ncbi:MAG: DNA polymerase III subunit chi [Sphingomonadales bacterium]
MAEIGFYHLQSQPLERALPRLLQKALAAGHRALVLAQDPALVDALDQALWCFDDASFLPHGRAGAAHEQAQPVLLATHLTDANQADILVALEDCLPDDLTRWRRCLYMFDGHDDAALTAARARWRALKDAGGEMRYFQQNPGGGWEQKG